VIRPLAAHAVIANALLATVALLAAAPAAFAQDAPPVAAPPSDYRWAIYTSCTVVFAAMVVYMVVTHNRAAAVAADVEAIERRLDDLEKK
jgi:hypothetical protein